ncbi:L-type lectin-domain containing receptor kinase VIII.1-like [Mangifera indica]|uniref:L-type lectin-domain containing receptor kinase VIII.1-like n=1 Tax=Mangifera indica TaxID=29780 RepID=UPI001CFBC026|nr:L-type lectin-domain containing receptor kinase VIII.1-like [Mangifera indica]
MATLPIAVFPLSIRLIILQILTLIAVPISSITLQTLSNNPHFDRGTALLGDAQVVKDKSHVQLVNPRASSSGLLIRTEPFKFLDPKGSKQTSFSTEFSFSISHGNVDGVAFVVFPYNPEYKFVGQGPFGVLSEKKYFAIEYDTKMDENVGDLNANHVGVDVNSLVSEAVSNISSFNLVLNNGEKLKSWIDYDSISKRIEVRLSKFGERRPYDPIVAHEIDLVKMWGNQDVFVGIVGSNGDSEQTSSVYSWNLRLRNFPHWLHSLPADPRAHEHGDRFRYHKRGVCPLKFLAGLIFATGCGALLAFAVLFAWAIVNRQTEIPTEYHVHPVNFKYEKIEVIVEEDGKGVKN